MTECPWCELEYDLTPETAHLAICPVFQTSPVAEVRDVRTFVALPSEPTILCERVRIQ